MEDICQCQIIVGFFHYFFRIFRTFYNFFFRTFISAILAFRALWDFPSVLFFTSSIFVLFSTIFEFFTISEVRITSTFSVLAVPYFGRIPYFDQYTIRPIYHFTLTVRYLETLLRRSLQNDFCRSSLSVEVKRLKSRKGRSTVLPQRSKYKKLLAKNIKIRTGENICNPFLNYVQCMKL